jgi:general secretion pathway protein K
VALILVLWTFAAVAVLAAEFARAMHDEAASTRNFKESERARMVAMAGISEAILALQADRRSPQQEDADLFGDDEAPDPVRALSYGDGRWVDATFREHRYQVRVIDEAGKLSLNLVDGQVLRTVFDNLDIDDDAAETIADSIVDWRDDDDLHLTNGAESDYYEGLARPYRAKNAAFDSVEELLLVRGVTRDIFYGHDEVPGLREIFSVFNQSRTVNLRSMTPAVMQALGGLDAETANEFGQSRRRGNSAATVDELKAVLGASGAGTRNQIPQQMTIEARVRDATGRTVLAHVGAVLNLSNDGDGLRLYRWYDSIFDDSDQSGGTSAADDAAS